MHASFSYHLLSTISLSGQAHIYFPFMFPPRRISSKRNSGGTERNQARVKPRAASCKAKSHLKRVLALSLPPETTFPPCRAVDARLSSLPHSSRAPDLPLLVRRTQLAHQPPPLVLARCPVCPTPLPAAWLLLQAVCPLNPRSVLSVKLATGRRDTSGAD